MVLFEPTNFRQGYTAGEDLLYDINRYVSNPSVRHGFLRNVQNARGTPTLTIEPARDRYQPRNNNPLSQRNWIRPQDFNFRLQNDIGTYRASEGLINRNKPEPKNATNRNKEPSPVLLTGNQIQRASTEVTQPIGINAIIKLSTQMNRAFQEYRNFSTAFGAPQNTIRNAAERYLRVQQDVPLGAQLLVTPSGQNQLVLTVTPPPTLSLALSYGIEQYTLNNSLVNKNGTVNGYTIDLYLSSNPTKRLLTQLLP